MTLTTTLLLSLGCWLLTGDGSSLPSGSEVLRRIAERDKDVGNLHIRCTFEEWSHGKPGGWEDLESFRDAAGRMRLIQSFGGYDESGVRTAPKPRVNELYDGELTVHEEFNPALDRVGQTPQEGRELGGYRWAQIFDGHFPGPNGVYSHRDPWTWLSAPVKRDLRKALSESATVQVRRSEAGPGILLVEYHRPSDERLPKSIATVDADRDWVLTRVEDIDADEQVCRIAECAYRNDGAGHWIPTEGSFRTIAEHQPKDFSNFDWRFSVGELTLNDPHFEESVLTVALEPDTAVSDLRFKVSYRVGVDRVFAKDLRALVDKAKAEGGGHVTYGSRQALALQDEAHRPRISWSAVTTAVLLLAIVALLIYRLRTSGR